MNIGRKHFQRLNGNRSDHPNDGYNLRGRGLIQITGFDKYGGLKLDYSKYWSDSPPNFVDNPEEVNKMPYAIHSALWYWFKYKVYMADKRQGYADVTRVIKLVNGGTKGLPERKTAYLEAQGIFK